jgi:hypothetical protein
MVARATPSATPRRVTMSSIWLGLSPGARSTRVLAMRGPSEPILKAHLSLSASSPRAVTALFEALALWEGAPVRAALAVDESSTSACQTTLYRDLFAVFGDTTPLYSLEWVTYEVRRRRRDGLTGNVGERLVSLRGGFHLRKTATVHAFSYVLVHSTRKYFDLYESNDLHALMDGHERAFTRFDACAAQCKYDSQKPVVLRWEGSQPIYNPRFLAFSSHYEFRPLAVRRNHPNDKPRTERSFWEVERSFLNGRDFRDLDDISHQRAPRAQNPARMREEQML